MTAFIVMSEKTKELKLKLKPKPRL